MQGGEDGRVWMKMDVEEGVSSIDNWMVEDRMYKEWVEVGGEDG